jgi:hypothetical protein
MAAYSFLDTSAFIVGPGLATNLGAGAAVAEEGIEFEPNVDKNVMTIGADGKGQHSLVADDSAKGIVRLLKTSPINALLMAAFDLQSSATALWGINTITITNTGLGDASVLTQVAFKKKPKVSYKKEGEFYEWEFDAISANTVLGAG